MAFRNILVHLDNSLPALARLQCAIAIAKEHSASLVGLVVHASHYYSGVHSDLSLADMEKEFFTRTAQAKISAEWRSVDLSIHHLGLAQVVNFHAYFSDLVIVGQELAAYGSPDIRSDPPHGLILSSGRPVLVVPSVGEFKTVGENVLIAWRLGREATRAIHDAMPIIETARTVEIVAARRQESDLNGVDMLLNLLNKHGIDAKFETILTSEISLGDILLNKAGDSGADLLVLGVYSRTHFGSLVLGEVGNHLLNHATLPVLMSH